MIRKRILSLLVCAALLCGVLAGCSTSSGSTAASSSSASASESIPSSTVTADTGKVGPLDVGENSLFSLSDPDDAFAPCLGWGPGVSGCSLKSVIAAASLLKWADGCNMSIQPVIDLCLDGSHICTVQIAEGHQPFRFPVSRRGPEQQSGSQQRRRRQQPYLPIHIRRGWKSGSSVSAGCRRSEYSQT
mgnify:CR=1 FL=1